MLFAKPISNIKEWNEANRSFWSKQKELDEKRLADEVTARIAYERVKCSDVPFSKQEQFSNLLAKAEEDKKLVLQILAQRGGKASKADTLNAEIRGIVVSKSEMPERAIYLELSRRAGRGVIISVKPNRILYKDHSGKEKAITGKALKHRIYRVRKQLKSLQPA